MHLIKEENFSLVLLQENFQVVVKDLQAIFFYRVKINKNKSCEEGTVNCYMIKVN